MEPSIDPGIEAQAAGRIHRLGQTREIFIKRYCFKGSIEECIIAVHDKMKTGEIKVRDGRVPPEASNVMREAAGDAVKQHDFSGVIHDAKWTDTTTQLTCEEIAEPLALRLQDQVPQGELVEALVQAAGLHPLWREPRLQGTSTWDGGGIFSYLHGTNITRDPPLAHDTPDDYTHFRPGGNGRPRRPAPAGQLVRHEWLRPPKRRESAR